MKKQMAAFFLAFVILVGVTTPNADAAASTLSLSGGLKLDFSGTTASCSFTVINANSDIKVTLALWQGNKQINSWTAEGCGLVVMSEQCPVSRGQTYTLKASFTIDGKAQPEQSTTKTNN